MLVVGASPVFSVAANNKHGIVEKRSGGSIAMVVDVQRGDPCPNVLMIGKEIYYQGARGEYSGYGNQRKEKPKQPKHWNMSQYVEPIQL